MSSLLTLPPRFLLPAWSGLQLSQLRVLHTPTSSSQEPVPARAPKPTEKSAHPTSTTDLRQNLIRKQRTDSDNRYLKTIYEHQLARNNYDLAAVTKRRSPAAVAGGHGVDTGETIGHTRRQPVQRSSARSRHQQLGKASRDFDLDQSQRNVEPFASLRTNSAVARGAKRATSAPTDSQPISSDDPRLKNASEPNQPKPSLFEELFPSEAKREKERVRPDLSPELFPSKPRQAPKDKEASSFDQGHNPSPSPSPTPTQRRQDNILDFAPSPLQKLHWQQDRLTIMVIMGLDPHLDETDFQRLLPRGEHIPEWRSPGDVLRVITARDPDTLAPRPMHYLVFANPTVARAYKAYVEQVHALARIHTPTSLLSDPIPPRGYFVQGINIHQLIQDYTLCPPSQDLKIRVLLPPYDRRLRTILAEQGYAALQRTEPEPKAGRSAIVWVDGYTPTTGGIKAMLSADGQVRGLPWGARAITGGVTMLGRDEDAEKRNQRTGPRKHDKQDERSATRDPSPVESEARTVAEDGNGNSNSGAASASASAPVHSKHGPTSAPPRWLLTFRDESEARRFVRTWHRRPYPFAHRDERARRENAGFGDVVPMVHAQFVW